jgi:membrane-associated phospholipid phosphatase
VALAATALLSWTQASAAQDDLTERLGDVLAVGIVATAGGATLVLDDFDGTREFVTGAAVNGLITEGLKRLLPKDRPDVSDRESFPSGHTSTAFQGASFIHFRYGLGYAIPAYVGAAFVGFSRVDARKHFWEDVLVGVALGTLSSRIFTSARPDDGQQPAAQLQVGLNLKFGSGMRLRLGPGGFAVTP